MASNAQILELLEEMLDSGKSPEDVCRDCPELLSAVRQRWHDFQLIDGQVRTLLPGLGSDLDSGTLAPPVNFAAPPAAFGRYQVQRMLGAGSFGAVYLGHDAQLNRSVAIKALRLGATASYTDDESVLQEARRLAQLRHPGIVAVHDIGKHEGRLYIVSDYLEGPNLDEWLREHRPSWAEAALVAAAVADALGHAHARLIVHRDVKPANILLTAEGDPVLVDFGLALDESLIGAPAKGIIAGTPSYMSPEQTLGAAHRIDGRTDIYSLGVVLYEMLTGRAPFRATNFGELLRQVRDDEPQPPRQLVGDIPPELEQVCLKALAKRQQDRYSTAGDFATELRRVIEASSSVSSLRPIPSVVPADRAGARTSASAASPSPVSQSGRLARSTISSVGRHTVGRQKELADLRHAFEQASGGQGLFVCMTGEPGIGKTTLVEDFLSELAASAGSFTVARGRCSERLAGTEAYLPFLEALESMLHRDQGEVVTRVMKRTAPNWYAEVAPLAADDSSLARVLAQSRAASQERLKRELGAFLHEMSQGQTLVLFLDDLHWADTSTVDLLAYLGGRCSGMRCLFIFTYRPTELAISKHPFGPVKLDLQTRGVCRELKLEFLSRPDIDRYLSLEFPEHSLPQEFTELIHARTEGSPLFMVDLLRYLSDRQVLSQEEGTWTLKQSLPDLRSELPESVRGMIQRKVDRLDDDARRLMVAASVQGYEFDTAIVAKVLGQDSAEVEERLDELSRVHAFVRMVREQEYPDRTLTVRYQFVHVLYQNVLYDSLQPTRRASLSAAVAQALLGYYGDRNDEVAADLALLLEAARDFAGAADYFLIAARNAAHVFANQETIVLARRGIEVLALLPDSPERDYKELALQITLGPALFATSDWAAPEVEAAYTRARVLCHALGESPDVFPAMWGLFLYHIARGEIQTGLDQGAQLLNLAQRAQNRAFILQAHHALGPAYGFVGDWTAARMHLEQAITCYDRREHSEHAFLYGGHDPCVCCLSYAAQALWMLGYPDQALQKGREALTLAREVAHPTSLAHTLHSVAILQQFHRDVSQTLELTEELLALAMDQGLLFYLAGGLVLQGWALVQQGSGDAGMKQMRQGFETGGATRAHWRSYSLTLLADALRSGGNITEALAVLREAHTVVEQTGIRMYEPEIHRLNGESLAALDPANLTDAETCFHRAIAIARRHQSKSLELRATLSLARLWRGLGRDVEARASLSAIYGTFTEGLTTPDLIEAAQLDLLT